PSRPAARTADGRQLTFGAHVARARPFVGRFFVEADALSLAQLIEVHLHRAAVEKPLLSAIVPDEPEPPIPNKSLDRATWHSRLLGHTHPEPQLQFSFRFSQQSLSGK